MSVYVCEHVSVTVCSREITTPHWALGIGHCVFVYVLFDRCSELENNLYTLWSMWQNSKKKKSQLLIVFANICGVKMIKRNMT